MAYKSIAVSLLVMLLAGCGGITPSTVHAGPALPAIGPDSLTCSGDTCSFVKNTQWGYCQGETHQFGKTFSVHLEIGVSELVKDVQTSGCAIPLAHSGGLVSSIHGNVNYIPFTNNLTSMATWVYAMNAGQKESLYSAKMALTKGEAQSIPMEGSSGQPIAFTTPIQTDAFLVWFNVDLPESLPNTISLGFSGTLE